MRSSPVQQEEEKAANNKNRPHTQPPKLPPIVLPPMMKRASFQWARLTRGSINQNRILLPSAAPQMAAISL